MAYQDTRLSAGDVLDALNSPQRRELLRSLQEESPRAWPEVTDPNTGSELQMKHCHLPKLANYSIIEMDAESDEIAVGPNIEDVRPMLELLTEYDR